MMNDMAGECRVDLVDLSDTGAALSTARLMAKEAGFEETDQYLIATAVSELATNIIRYAGRGAVNIRIIQDDERTGLEVIAQDSGPGIEDIEQAMQDNYSTGNSLGLGLPGVKRIMDEFTIESRVGQGTTCTARKWRR
ncbi:serine/threonine-protein kinase RsbT [Desulfobaculum xiamenense]|uniref:Serine/threonine-protein kinase RsbT n=1 Tax=Desulfobaculum xiamenense TaxID=995050 RepID=A0A846QXS2_9BACT|nr:anti-sigma regulatory factor [Desulfobaculum xiamenense]NJB69429.1 serine/threonine-protein kinase RsbT [Desulfobaculum xiamenense]